VAAHAVKRSGYSQWVPRSRMTPTQRRDQLLDVGAVMFSEQPFDDVSMEAVAAGADVSRALVYHYFANKKELFAAIWKRAHDDLLQAATFDDTAPLVEQVRHALTAHFAFYERHAPLVFLANRSDIALDPVVRAPIAADLDTMRQRLLDAAGLTGHARVVAAAGLLGWLSLVREVAIEWLERHDLSRHEAIELCLAALGGFLALDADAGAGRQRSAGPIQRSR
jgi:AcrR family transcriptional regulator